MRDSRFRRENKRLRRIEQTLSNLLTSILIATICLGTPGGGFTEAHSAETTENFNSILPRPVGDVVDTIEGFGNGFLPENEIKSPNDLMEQYLNVRPNTLSQEYILLAKELFSQGSQDRWGSDGGRNAVLMFMQFLHLETFRAERIEYLMYHAASTLLLNKSYNAEQAVAYFERLFPISLFKTDINVRIPSKSISQKVTRFPTLLELRNRYRTEISKLFAEPNRGQQSALIDKSISNIEASYLSLAFVRVFKKNLSGLHNETINESDYTLEISKLNDQETIIHNESPILRTKSFKSVNHEFDRGAVDEQAGAIIGELYDFRDQFNRFLEKKASVLDFFEFLDDSTLTSLTTNIEKTLNMRLQNDFRSSIRKALPGAITEIQKNQSATIANMAEDLGNFDLLESIYLINSQTQIPTKPFETWLEHSQAEYLHGVIENEMPFLQPGLLNLSRHLNIRTEATNSQFWKRLITFTAVAGAASFFLPTRKPMQKYMAGRIGKIGLLVPNALFLGSQIYFEGPTVVQFINYFHRHHEIKTLSLLTLNGKGLTDVASQEEFFKNIRLMGLPVFGMVALTGVTAWATIFPFLPIQKFLNKGTSKKSSILRNFANAARGNEAQVITPKKWEQMIKKSGAEVEAAKLKVGNSTNRYLNILRTQTSGQVWKARAQWGQRISGLLMQQKLVALSQLGPIFGKFKESVTFALTLSIVMNLLQLTVQHHFSAATMGGFVKLMEKVGIPVPSLWIQNSYDQAFLHSRGGLLNAMDTFKFVQSTIVLHHSKIQEYKRELTQLKYSTDMPRDEAAKMQLSIQADIVSNEKVIDGQLTDAVISWYMRTEYRQIYNQALRKLGFGIVPVPDWNDPQEVTILYKAGEVTYHKTLKKEEMDRMMTDKKLPSIQNFVAENAEDDHDFQDTLKDFFESLSGGASARDSENEDLNRVIDQLIGDEDEFELFSTEKESEDAA